MIDFTFFVSINISINIDSLTPSVWEVLNRLKKYIVNDNGCNHNYTNSHPYMNMNTQQIYMCYKVLLNSCITAVNRSANLHI